MCYYQNVHTSYHHDLLSIDAAQRAVHRCARRYPHYKADKCPLHTCCRISRELVVTCAEAQGTRFGMVTTTAAAAAVRSSGDNRGTGKFNQRPDKDGEERQGDGGEDDWIDVSLDDSRVLCKYAFVEDVHMPFAADEAWLLERGAHHLAGTRDGGQVLEMRPLAGSDDRLGAVADMVYPDGPQRSRTGRSQATGGFESWLSWICCCWGAW